jgi:hypothetical protein
MDVMVEYAGFFFRVIVEYEDESSTLLRNVCNVLTEYSP